MKRTNYLCIFLLLPTLTLGQIVADYTVVDKFDQIPQYYMDEVRKIWLVVAGESHSQGCRIGLIMDQTHDATYAVNNTLTGTSEGALRMAKAMWWILARLAGWDGVSDSVSGTSTNTSLARYVEGVQTGKSTMLSASAQIKM